MVDADGLRGAVQMGLVLGIQLAGFFFSSVRTVSKHMRKIRGSVGDARITYESQKPT